MDFAKAMLMATAAKDRLTLIDLRLMVGLVAEATGPIAPA
jgi:hypothetical protein